MINTKLNQLEARFSSSRGEALPNDLPVTLPVTKMEEVDTLNIYLEDQYNMKLLVRTIYL